MHRTCFICATLMIVLVVQASAFETSISITGDNVIGGNIAIKCSWVSSPNELLDLTILPFPNLGSQNDDYYYQVTQTGLFYPGSQRHNRLSLDNANASYVNITGQSVIMKISGLQCSDDLDYYCIYRTFVPNASPKYVTNTTHLTVKARPKSPSIRIVPNTSTEIMEQTNVSVTCNANLGRPGRGSIQWKIYRSGTPEIILPSDSRIEKRNVTLLPGDDNCTERVEQTFKMRVNRTDQNLVIACFVQNVDFTPDQTPDVCQNSTTDLCSQTGTLKIVYAVSEATMTVTREPPGVIYQGMTVTLTCQAEGLPAPTYTWIKGGDDNTTMSGDNSTLSGQMVDNKSQLVLSNVVASRDQEFSCTASNTVFGNLYSASQKETFDILLTTTTTSTTTTTTATTTRVTTNTVGGSAGGGTKPQSGNKDDDPTTTIIIVVVVVGSILIIGIVIGVICWRRQRSKKEVEEPSEKPYNNRTNLSFQNSQPDLVADKKLHSPNLDNVNSKSSLSGSIPSFTEKKEDGLMYADLTYDNKPRSRKPMAINDTSSEYSDIQMPQV